LVNFTRLAIKIVNINHMTVHFIGAGPGAADLVTIRGRDLIAKCPVCLFAGSLVPKEVVAFAPEGALVRDTASMNLDEIVEEIQTAHDSGKDVARVHSGDPSIYGATSEQMRRLDVLGIPYDVTPGVPAFVAAAAELGINSAGNKPNHHCHSYDHACLGHARR